MVADKVSPVPGGSSPADRAREGTVPARGSGVQAAVREGAPRPLKRRASAQDRAGISARAARAVTSSFWIICDFFSILLISALVVQGCDRKLGWTMAQTEGAKMCQRRLARVAKALQDFIAARRHFFD